MTTTGNSGDDLLSFLRRHLVRAAGNWQVIGPDPRVPPVAEEPYMIGDGNGCHGASGLVVLREHVVSA